MSAADKLSYVWLICATVFLFSNGALATDPPNPNAIEAQAIASAIGAIPNAVYNTVFCNCSGKKFKDGDALPIIDYGFYSQNYPNGTKNFTCSDMDQTKIFHMFFVGFAAFIDSINPKQVVKAILKILGFVLMIGFNGETDYSKIVCNFLIYIKAIIEVVKRILPCISPDLTILAGHSLGAQVVPYISRYIYAETKKPVALALLLELVRICFQGLFKIAEPAIAIAKLTVSLRTSGISIEHYSSANATINTNGAATEIGQPECFNSPSAACNHLLSYCLYVLSIQFPILFELLKEGFPTGKYFNELLNNTYYGNYITYTKDFCIDYVLSYISSEPSAGITSA